MHDKTPSPAGGVAVPAEITGPVWLVLRAWRDRHRANGGQLHPAAARFLDDLRAAALAHVIAPSGHDPAPVPDIGADCDHVSTDRLAGLLDVSDRHARRLMVAGGYQQTRRGVWRAEDAAALVAARRR